MYEKLGYIVYRRVLGYYTGTRIEDEEDAFGTLFPLSQFVFVVLEGTVTPTSD
jgi:hypothetical protein